MGEGYGPEWQDNPDREGGGVSGGIGCIILIIWVVVAIVGGIIFIATRDGNSIAPNSTQNYDNTPYDDPGPLHYPDPPIPDKGY